MRRILLPAAALSLALAACASRGGPAPGAPAPSPEREEGADASRWSAVERETVELSFISLAGFWHADPAKVAGEVSRLLGEMFPRMGLVWGPAVHQPLEGKMRASPFASDALALICRDRDTGEVFVVFRGTNPISSMEWLLQDFQVSAQRPWREISPGPAPEGALISEGAASAISLRLALRPAPGAPGGGRTLAEALEDLAAGAGDRRVIHFTGHSLGGLLAPAAALWLEERLAARGRAELAERLEMDVYGYAAPTAGNLAFADYLASRLPTLRRYANDLDVVPLAWEEASLASMPALYEPEIRMGAVLRSMHDLGAGLARGRGYAQPGERLLVPAGVEPVAGGLYLLEAIYQHSLPYLDMLEPDRKEILLREVYRPLAKLLPVRGVKRVDLRRLFAQDEGIGRSFPSGPAAAPPRPPLEPPPRR